MPDNWFRTNGKVTGLTSRIGWTEVFPERTFSVGVEGFNIPCVLWLRWAATVLDLVLFLGGYPSDIKDWDLGWAVLFLGVADFFSLTVTCGGVEFGHISVISDVSKGGSTSKWVFIVSTTGGGENNHLCSLRNAWGVVGVLLAEYSVHLPKVPQIFLVKEAQVEKDHYP